MATELQGLLERTVVGLGYELVDAELSNRGRMLRILIDKAVAVRAGGDSGTGGAETGNVETGNVRAAAQGGITVDDCALVSHQLTRVLEVEGIDYDRLEVSSPGLDRPLKKEADFARFAGQRARLTLRMPINGRRNFTGVMRSVAAGRLTLEIEGGAVSIDLADVDKARLVPELEF